jgi:hypothetical protein
MAWTKPTSTDRLRHPVVASMDYPPSRTSQDVEGLAIAWTRERVEAAWSFRREQQANWIEARCVKLR